MALATTNPFTYSRSELRFFLRGRAIDPALVKSGAEAIVKQSRFTISDLSLKLQQGKISVEEWYAGMKEATKLAHMANAALARGGFSEMRPADWKKVEEKIFNQWNGVEGKFPGLRRFAEDIERGRYGRGTADGGMSGMVTQRSGLYSDASRATFENTRTEVHQENGYGYATRIAGAVDHCPTCQDENGIKRPIDEIVEIGDSECGSKCHCILIYDRDAEGALSGPAPRREAADRADVIPLTPRAPRETVAANNEPVVVTRSEQSTLRTPAEPIPAPVAIKEVKPEPVKVAAEPKLTRDERNALEDYSGDKFQQVNGYLRDGGTGDKDLDGIVKGVDSALEKLPNTEEIKYRTFGIDDGDQFRAFVDSLQPGASYKDDAYMSTSDRPRGLQALGSGKVNFEIRGNVGSDISRFSNNPGEREVLIPRGAEFEVLERREGQYGEVYFVLQHKG